MSDKHCRWPNGILLTACLVGLSPSVVLAEDCVPGESEASVYSRRIPGKATVKCEPATAPAATSTPAPTATSPTTTSTTTSTTAPTSAPVMTPTVSQVEAQTEVQTKPSQAAPAEQSDIPEVPAVRPVVEQPVAEIAPSEKVPTQSVSSESAPAASDREAAATSEKVVTPAANASAPKTKQKSKRVVQTRALDRPVQLSDYENAQPTVFKDRWRIVEDLGYDNNPLDPYNRNTLKADVPLHDDWFFNLGVISDTVYELRDVPTPVGNSTTAGAGSVDVFGGPEQSLLNQNLLVELVYYKGDTTFKPPDYEYRLITVFNYNSSLDRAPL